MSLLLDTQYLEGFVTEEELARCAGPLAAVSRIVLHNGTVYLMNQIRDQSRIQIIAGRRFSG